MKNYRIAILIADVAEDSFMDIKMHMGNLVWDKFQSQGIDVFYIKGRDLNALQSMRINWIERVRYSKFWFLQYGHDYFTMFRYKFIRPKTRIKGQDISVDVPEGMSRLTIKMIAGLEILERLGYDYVYRTTLSTVVDLEILQKSVDALGIEDEKYAGYLIDFNTHPFISGSSTLVNSKAIRLLGKNRYRLNFARLDDVAIGRVLEKLVRPISIPHLNINSTSDVNKISEEEIRKVLSYRCKTNTIPRTDWQIAKQLILKLQNQK